MTVTGFDDIGAVSLRIQFADTVLSYAGLTTEQGVTFTANAVGSEVRIEWFDLSGGFMPLDFGSGVLLTLNFDIVGAAPDSSGLVFLPASTIADSAGDPLEDVAYADGSVVVTDPGGLPDPVPAEFLLHGCHPNPFNPVTEIVFDLPGERSRSLAVRLDVYDLTGRRIRTLVRDRLEPGRHVATWRGKDDSGRRVPSGTYICRLEAGSYVGNRKMTLVR